MKQRKHDKPKTNKKIMTLRIRSYERAFILLGAYEGKSQEFTRYIVNAAIQNASTELGEEFDPANAVNYVTRFEKIRQADPDHPLFSRLK